MATAAGSRRALPTNGSTDTREAALKAKTVRIWSVVHTWSSLISTLFLLLLCVTGLPLIFHHEIDELLGYDPKPEIVQPGTAKRSIDEIARTALAHDPGRVLQYILRDKDEPGFRRKTVCYGRTGKGMDWSRHLRKAGHVLGLAKDFIKARLGTAVATLLRPARPRPAVC